MRKRRAGGASGADDALTLFGESAGEPAGANPRPVGAAPAGARALAEPSVVAEPVETVSDAYPGERPDSAIAVGTLTRTAKDVVEGAFVPLWVRGEISDFKAHRNGHWYFCLRDAQAQIRCVVWSRDARRIPAPPDEGMQVAVLGQLTVYAARGDMQLQVVAMEAEGDGLWRKALERTRLALERDGLLDPARKRSLPAFPRVVALITSRDGAALHDLVSVSRRRWPSTQLVLVPAAVQGESAPESLRAALDRVTRWGGADVLIIGRGGGAREDLWAFNDERLVRALAECPIPTVSAVGHEVDVTLCDLVADVRAPTPSAAAELVVPLRSRAVDAVRAMSMALERGAASCVRDARLRTADVATSLTRVAGRLVERRRSALDGAAGRLHALSPLATLGRGYAVVRDPAGAPVVRARGVSVGASLEIVFRDGLVRAVAREIEPSDPPPPDPTDDRSSSIFPG